MAVWIHIWLRSDAHSLKWHRGEALLFFRGHLSIFKVTWAEKSTIWLLFGLTDGFEMPHMLLWAWNRLPIVLYHLSNAKVTQAAKSIWITFEITRPVAAIKSRTFSLLLLETQIMLTPCHYSYTSVLLHVGKHSFLCKNTSLVWLRTITKIIEVGQPFT